MSWFVGALAGIFSSVATSLTIVLTSEAYKKIEDNMNLQGSRGDTYNADAQTALLNSSLSGVFGGLFLGAIGGNLSNRIIKDYGLIGGISCGIAAGVVSGLRNIPEMPESSEMLPMQKNPIKS